MKTLKLVLCGVASLAALAQPLIGQVETEYKEGEIIVPIALTRNDPGLLT